MASRREAVRGRRQTRAREPREAPNALVPWHCQKTRFTRFSFLQRRSILLGDPLNGARFVRTGRVPVALARLVVSCRRSFERVDDHRDTATIRITARTGWPVVRERLLSNDAAVAPPSRGLLTVSGSPFVRPFGRYPSTRIGKARSSFGRQRPTSWSRSCCTAGCNCFGISLLERIDRLSPQPDGYDSMWSCRRHTILAPVPRECPILSHQLQLILSVFVNTSQF